METPICKPKKEKCYGAGYTKKRAVLLSRNEDAVTL